MNIALVAHDARKAEMLEWVKYNYKTLSHHNLYATGTTGRLIEEIMIGSPLVTEIMHNGGIETIENLYPTNGLNSFKYMS